MTDEESSHSHSDVLPPTPFAQLFRAGKIQIRKHLYFSHCIDLHCFICTTQRWFYSGHCTLSKKCAWGAIISTLYGGICGHASFKII